MAGVVERPFSNLQTPKSRQPFSVVEIAFIDRCAFWRREEVIFWSPTLWLVSLKDLDKIIVEMDFAIASLCLSFGFVALNTTPLNSLSLVYHINPLLP